MDSETLNRLLAAIDDLAESNRELAAAVRENSAAILHDDEEEESAMMED